jgi:hypothetical protein
MVNDELSPIFLRADGIGVQLTNGAVVTNPQKEQSLSGRATGRSPDGADAYSRGLVRPPNRVAPNSLLATPTEGEMGIEGNRR